MTRFTYLALLFWRFLTDSDALWKYFVQCTVYTVQCTLYSVNPLHSYFLFLNTFHFVGTFFVLKRYTDFDASWKYFVQCTSFTLMLYFVYKYVPFRGNALCPETIHRLWCIVKVFCTMYSVHPLHSCYILFLNIMLHFVGTLFVQTWHHI